jgi:hypothetical protein
MVERRTGNRFSMGLTLTDREAIRLAKMALAIEKMSKKEGRYVMERRNLRDAAIRLRLTIKDADRSYVFDNLPKA